MHVRPLVAAAILAMWSSAALARDLAVVALTPAQRAAVAAYLNYQE